MFTLSCASAASDFCRESMTICWSLMVLALNSVARESSVVTVVLIVTRRSIDSSVCSNAAWLTGRPFWSSKHKRYKVMIGGRRRRIFRHDGNRHVHGHLACRFAAATRHRLGNAVGVKGSAHGNVSREVSSSVAQKRIKSQA